ncbi:NRDE family protein [Thiohalorhabdus sp. Cl-TMA]|uniref:NRDE family protein n=1 Tax=Thiohalorhabdus methylotrophus TaxID=3242694 RepID=A0ABV4TX90_9GAMM
MCTLIVLRRPHHDWPLLVGANRDEMRGRAWERPGRHWPEKPEVVGGLDEHGHGSWLGVNRYGMVAAVANRTGTLGPMDDKRSRGELVLEALEHAEPERAASALAELEPRAYRAFNLLVGGPSTAYWIAHREDDGGDIEVREVGEGLHMLTSGDLDDPTDYRINFNLPRFREAAAPDPELEDWDTWRTLLADRGHPEGYASAAMNLDHDGFGTICSHLVAIPRYPGYGGGPQFWFAAGPPDRTPFESIAVPY